MKKQKVMICVALVLACALTAASASEALTGKWSGSADVSGMLFPVSVSVQFNQDGTFSLSTFGLTAKGTYSADGKTMTVSVSEFGGLWAGLMASPSSLGSVQASMSMKDANTLSLSANTHGMEASVSLKKK